MAPRGSKPACEQARILLTKQSGDDRLRHADAAILDLDPKFVKAKREAFNTAVDARTGESLQDAKIDEVVAKLVEDHYSLDPSGFD